MLARSVRLLRQASRAQAQWPPTSRLASHERSRRTLSTPGETTSTTGTSQPNEEPTISKSESSANSASPDTVTQEHDVNNTQSLTEELAKRDATIAELNDRALRVLAEMENVRTIARRDVQNANTYGISKFAKSLLSVADNLELALKAVPEEKLQQDDTLRGLHIGVQATEKELLKVFEQNGLVRFGQIGETFDPNRHQALFEAPNPEIEPGKVTDITKFGYELGERILRPAEVGVSKAP